MSRDLFTSNGTLIDESGSYQSVSADGTVTNETSSSGPAPVNLVGVIQTSVGISPPGAVTVTAGGVTFAVTSPASGRIFQRVAGKADIPVTVTYSNGTPASIQARVVQAGTNTLVGGDWATVVASPSGGSASFTLANVPQGSTFYDIQVRDSAAPTVVTTFSKFAVGVLIATAGQSNMMKWFVTGDAAIVPVPDSRLMVFGTSTSNAWVSPAQTTMAGAIGYGNALIAALGVPVGLLDFGVDGSAMVSYSAPNRWINTGGVAGTYYTAFKNGVSLVTSRVEQVIWIQGETDAVYGVTEDDYKAGLDALFSLFRSDFGTSTTPIILSLLGWRTLNVTATLDASWDGIRRAEVRKCADPYVYRVDRHDIYPYDGGIHYSAAGYLTLGARCAQASAYAAGAATYYRGPHITGARQVSSTVYDVTIVHNAGTDFTPGSAITGFRVLDGTTEIAVSNAVRYNATTIRATLASAPSALPTFAYDYGCQPAGTGFVKDNTSLALPLEYLSSVTATLGRTITIKLTSDGTTARANLTGLKWAWFDQATPDAFLAPVNQGTGGATDGSGMLSLTLGNTTLSAGQTGWLSVTDSDGTATQSPPAKAFSGPVVVS